MNDLTNKPKAVVLLSGGIDSAVCLAMAKSLGYSCYSLCIDYNQRHRVEIQAAANVAQAMEVAGHRVVKLAIGDWGGSALTDPALKLNNNPSKSIPNTYVPARNTIFLATALAWAEVLDANAIFFGANQDDYANYPDCRPQYFHAFEKMATLATRTGIEGEMIKIHTPLITLDKIAIVAKGQELGVDFSITFSCYDPIENFHPCLQCDACQLRGRALASFSS